MSIAAWIVFCLIVVCQAVVGVGMVVEHFKEKHPATEPRGVLGWIAARLGRRGVRAGKQIPNVLPAGLFPAPSARRGPIFGRLSPFAGLGGRGSRRVRRGPSRAA